MGSTICTLKPSKQWFLSPVVKKGRISKRSNNKSTPASGRFVALMTNCSSKFKIDFWARVSCIVSFLADGYHASYHAMDNFYTSHAVHDAQFCSRCATCRDGPCFVVSLSRASRWLARRIRADRVSKCCWTSTTRCTRGSTVNTRSASKRSKRRASWACFRRKEDSCSSDYGMVEWTDVLILCCSCFLFRVAA